MQLYSRAAGRCIAALICAAVLLPGCGGGKQAEGHRSTDFARQNAFPSTYSVKQSRPVLIEGATVLTGTGERLDNTDLLLEDGKIARIGDNLEAPKDALVVKGAGKWVTPGIIDAHSHLGDYPAPEIESTQDGNEMTAPNTAEVWAEHSVWTQDPQFALALAGGVTTLQILPGSANLFGGRGVTLKNVPGRSVQEMKFPGAPYGLKMACGENPKRVYGSKGSAPSTRMGNVAGYRKAWIEATAYKKKWENYWENGGDMPERDLQLETLAGVLSGEILVHNHCYRGEEMAIMMDIAEEFDFQISAFHHAVEAYKVADLLAERGVCAAMWADWWGFKHEAFDMTEANIAIVDQAGACAMIHSDSAIGIQHLNEEVAKAMTAGQRAGFDIQPQDAVAWMTLNPAKALGIDDQTGSLEKGKMADVVVWSGNPFSVYSQAEKVFIDGELMYDRADRARQPRSDFELGILDAEGERL
ncbi:amidohydrolase [Microbulbifer thermotolerans]|uniref:Amidohydrolase n=1 Tax=Microbulbifer thermotolerans TaxID=252514 RepID=A0A143HKY0_MICTH|nr:amidohydrolase [Microbulbifer thermotolerans]AMX02374.1 amidohydrolase [Microbulbifer thermotolerans]MCX2779979.1 amidohydrolase [Microbulbifer thermotolerans]MCX2805402.1 amidohydrolase [Microbulbifer thermotolerans]MCX2832071.1 amidohydrolase [Microbulbifer thermotolerans]WKT61988.1 amidohydrolase [Microbulbifer thermotolerans]